MSRIGIPSPPSIEFEGRRYEQIINGERLGLGQRTGLLAVTDVATGQRLAAVSIYDLPRDPEMEADVEDVFFTAAELDAGRRRIVIENERRQRFAFRIDDRSVQPLD